MEPRRPLAALGGKFGQQVHCEFVEFNRRRAETFLADVFREVQANETKLDATRLSQALNLIKEKRRAKVAALIESASAGRIRLR